MNCSAMHDNHVAMLQANLQCIMVNLLWIALLLASGGWNVRAFLRTERHLRGRSKRQSSYGRSELLLSIIVILYCIQLDLFPDWINELLTEISSFSI